MDSIQINELLKFLLLNVGRKVIRCEPLLQAGTFISSFSWSSKTSVLQCLHSGRSMWRQSTDWKRPCRNTSHIPAGCHVADCRILVYNDRSSRPRHFPAWEKDKKDQKGKRSEKATRKVYDLHSNWSYEHEACNCRVNLVKMMMKRLERLTQSACH